VYGVAVHEGRAYASAGRHPELDHGLFVVGLDAATGDAVWTTRLALDPTWGKSLEGGARGPFYLMNAPPSLAAGNKLKIAGAPRLDLATGILSDPHKVYTSAPVPRQPSGYRPAER
jgi:hypothetical protein